MRVLFCLLGFLLFGGCCSLPDDSAWQRFEYVDPEMGVDFHLKFYAKDRPTAERIARQTYARVEALNAIFSDYDPTSELNRLCQKPHGQPIKVSRELFDILQRAQILARETDGAFDITAGPMIRLWRIARKQQKLPTPEALAAVKPRVGFGKIKLNGRNRTVTLRAPQMQLDLGGIAKGYAVDEAMEILKANCIHRAFVAASGDLLTSSPPLSDPEGWRVLIRNVDQFGNLYPRTVHLKHQALSTSGDTEQFVEINGRRYSHIVDPRTGYGLTHRMQVTVISEASTQSDSHATAISVVGIKHGLKFAKQKKLQAIILDLKTKKPRITESEWWKW
ncbi:MAG: FAD:protein FMN transferase [Verrucomicrobiota bacterium]|nr:FAD:protein FMN transferase [Verrucomicrobiota bacterium]